MIHVLHFMLWASATLMAFGICCGLVAAWLSFRPAPKVTPLERDDHLDALARLAEERLVHLPDIAAAEFRWNASRWT